MSFTSGPTLVPAPAGDGSTTVYHGSITITVTPPGQSYTLEGTLGSAFIMEYHQPFATAISLGPVGQIAPAIATALGFGGFASDITNALTEITKIPVIGPIVNVIETASARITDIVINTASSTYEIGLALDFTTSTPRPELFGISLDSLGFKVTSTKTS